MFGEPSAVAVGFRAVRSFGPRDINERVDLGWCVGGALVLRVGAGRVALSSRGHCVRGCKDCRVGLGLPGAGCDAIGRWWNGASHAGLVWLCWVWSCCGSGA